LAARRVTAAAPRGQIGGRHFGRQVLGAGQQLAGAAEPNDVAKLGISRLGVVLPG
jgi:hypothetical protein